MPQLKIEMTKRFLLKTHQYNTSSVDIVYWVTNVQRLCIQIQKTEKCIAYHLMHEEKCFLGWMARDAKFSIAMN